MDPLSQQNSQPQKNPILSNFKLIILTGSVVLLILVIGVTLLPRLNQKKSNSPNPSPKITFEDYNIDKPEVVDKRVEHLNNITPEEKTILKKNFSIDWPNAKNDIKKFGAYSNLYSSLWARYNVTKDPSIKEEMSKIEGFLKQTWPGIYGTGEGFLK